jgi:transposase
MASEQIQEIEQLELLGKQVKGKREYKRLQSVILKVKNGKGAAEIADLLQLNVRTVYKHQERYRKEGLSAFESKKPGPPSGSRLMSREEEKALLNRLEECAGEGQLLTASQVKQACEEKLEKPVALSTVYLILHRNAWSKQRPRPRHPQGDEEAKTAFKKIR